MNKLRQLVADALTVVVLVVGLVWYGAFARKRPGRDEPPFEPGELDEYQLPLPDRDEFRPGP